MPSASSTTTASLPSWFELQDYHTARDFVAALQPSGSAWSTDKFGISNWYFRGQWDATLPLLPRLFRTPLDPLVERVAASLESDVEACLMRANHLASIDRHRTVFSITSSEFELVERFRALADAVGHDMGDLWAYDGREWLESPHAHSDQYCTPRFLSAMAQHHGIPTRALDWTTHPLYAAFFASNKSTAAIVSCDHLAVWALSQDCVKTRTGSKTTEHRLARVWLPVSRVEYVRAQHGVLLFDARPNLFYMKEGRWPDVLDSIESSTAIDKSKVQLRKLTLPHSELPALRQALMAHRISHAFLMPSLDNIARTVADVFFNGAP